MKAALAVIDREQSREKALEKVICAIKEAASAGSDIVFFAETTISGFVQSEHAHEVRAVAHEIPGGTTNRISCVCKENNIWVSISLLEKEEGKLFDSAVLVSPSGNIELKYRRISPQWYFWKSDKADHEVFCQGNDVTYADTPFGRMSVLICGDIYGKEGQHQMLKDVKPDFLHVALAYYTGRGETCNQEKWDEEILPNYTALVRKVGVPVFMVGYVDEEFPEGPDGTYVGGATVFSADGTVLSSLPLHQEGILYHEISNKAMQSAARSSRR
jgi:predicted amidohydrolase